jgi:O-antigen/teichoic acid export membrane protein
VTVGAQTALPTRDERVVPTHRDVFTPPPGAPPGRGDALTHKQIRGSSLLLAGRGISTGVKFLAELLVVRYLATGEYGAWTYALSAVAFLRVLSGVGLNRAVPRFGPLHLERGEPREFFGVVGMVVGCILVTGLAIVAAFYAFPERVAALVGAGAGQNLYLLFIVVFLVPVEALDSVLTSLCAIFTDSRTIFVRRYLVAPGVRLALAFTLVALQAPVTVLAYGYLVAGLIGVAYYGWCVAGIMRREGLLRRVNLRSVRVPVRRVLSYTMPVAAADLMAVSMAAAGPLLLGYFAGMDQVALFQVVVPLAILNDVVHQSFGVMYEPAAARLLARGDRAELDRFYWRCAAWVAVLSFPFFALTFTAAEPLTVFLYGERYRDSAPILSLLAVGVFSHCAVGFNEAMLRVAGRLRWLLTINLAAAATNILLNVVLIRRFGALGAGIATGTSYLLFAVLKQCALRATAGISLFGRAYAVPYLAILGTVLPLIALRLLLPAHSLLLALAAVVAGGVVFAFARTSLTIRETFPELARSRALRLLLG